MKRIISIIVALIIGGYLVISYLGNKASDAQRAEAKRTEQFIRSAVAEMVSRTGAIDDWERRLSWGETLRYEPILTFELEKLWLGTRPILFTGAIEDIATSDESHYTVLVINTNVRFVRTELQLSLLSTKQQIDSFLKQHPNLFRGLLNNGIAVIARVKTIQTAYVHWTGDKREEVKIGVGELVDILYTGDVL